MIALDKLPAETQQKLKNLLKAVEEILAQPSAHTQAITESNMRDGWTAKDTLGGGTLRAPAKPPFPYDKSTLIGLHRELLQSGGGVLSGIIVHARRPDKKGKWTLQVKLVARADHEEMDKQRRPIDTQMQPLLEAFNPKKDYEYVTFGRDTRNPEPFLNRFGPQGLERLTPPADCLALLQKADAIYTPFGLVLRTARWTLEGKKIEFGEYVE